MINFTLLFCTSSTVWDSLTTRQAMILHDLCHPNLKTVCSLLSLTFNSTPTDVYTEINAASFMLNMLLHNITINVIVKKKLLRKIQYLQFYTVTLMQILLSTVNEFIKQS